MHMTIHLHKFMTIHWIPHTIYTTHFVTIVMKCAHIAWPLLELLSFFILCACFAAVLKFEIWAARQAHTTGHD